MLGITDYLWRLIPANPILLRVVETGGKRKRDLFIRCGYLGLLVLLVVFSLVTASTSTSGTSLSDLTKTSSRIFSQMSFLQLGLVALLAPIFTAGAITQEKDSQTYDILLATPLTNGQIVLGSLMSRLFFVIALLISGIPVFSVTQIFGGVAINAIVLSFAIAAATAFVTGALAMAIATFKVGTRRTIFSFYLFIVIYLVGLYLLDRMDYFKIPIVDPQTARSSRPARAGSPDCIRFWHCRRFCMTRTISRRIYRRCPKISAAGRSGGIFESGQLLHRLHVLPEPRAGDAVDPAAAADGAVDAVAQGMVLQKLHISSGEKRRKPRYVWQNPIAWREAKTKASAFRASILRYGFIAPGLIGAGSLVWMLFAEDRIAIRRLQLSRQHHFYRRQRGRHVLLCRERASRSTTSRSTKPSDTDSRRQLRGRRASRFSQHPRPKDAEQSLPERSASQLSAAEGEKLSAGRVDSRIRGDSADRHQRRGFDGDTREGGRQPRFAADHADHQPLLRLGQASRAGAS